MPTCCEVKMATQSLCSIHGCGKPADKRGWCGMHYRRWQRHGDPSAHTPARVPPGSRLQWLLNHAAYEGDDCLRWPFPYDPNGYGSVTRGGKTFSASRIICEEAHGAPPSPDHEAAHSCGRGNAGCLNRNHIRWLLPVDNQAERLAHGTDVRGEKNVHHKLTEQDVLAIRCLEGVEGPSAVGKAYGVSKTAVMKIWRRENWGWL